MRVLGYRKNLGATKVKAPPQLPHSSVLGARIWLAGGASVAPRHAVLWPRHPGGVWPAAALPASGEPAAGILHPGSNAGSNAAAGTSVLSVCAGKSAPAAGVHWHNDGTLLYCGRNPREPISPKGQPGENVLPFFPGACPNR